MSSTLTATRSTPSPSTTRSSSPRPASTRSAASPAPQPATQTRTSTPSSAGSSDRVSLSAEAQAPSRARVEAGQVPTLTAPLATVHGLNSGATAFQDFHNRLSANPNNPFGGVCRNGVIENANPKGNHFAVEFSSGTNPTATNAKELSNCTAAISALTGAPEVDVVAHSQGGLATRDALNLPGENIRRAALVGTPNAGTPFAETTGQLFPAAAALTPGSFPRANANAQQAVDDLRPNSPLVQRVNSGLDAQRQNAELMTVAGSGAPTLSTGGRAGDGVVPRDSAVLPGVPNRDAQNCDHLTFQNDPSVQNAVLDFLGGHGASGAPVTCQGVVNDFNQSVASAQENVASSFNALRNRLGL